MTSLAWSMLCTIIDELVASCKYFCDGRGLTASLTQATDLRDVGFCILRWIGYHRLAIKASYNESGALMFIAQSKVMNSTDVRSSSSKSCCKAEVRSFWKELALQMTVFYIFYVFYRSTVCSGC